MLQEFWESAFETKKRYPVCKYAGKQKELNMAAKVELGHNKPESGSESEELGKFVFASWAMEKL